VEAMPAGAPMEPASGNKDRKRSTMPHFLPHSDHPTVSIPIVDLEQDTQLQNE